MEHRAHFEHFGVGSAFSAPTNVSPMVPGMASMSTPISVL